MVIYISDDNILMEETNRGNKEAFERLVLKHRKKAIGFAFSFLKDVHMAEDIVQESFAVIYINRSKYEPKNTFKTFLFTIIKNRCIDYWRKNKDYSPLNIDYIKLRSDKLMPDELLEQIYKSTTENLAKLAKGKIYEITLPYGELDKFKEKYKVISMISQGNYTTFRILSDNKPFDDALICEPTIEDGYMLLMEER